jgi:hypothetical protein
MNVYETNLDETPDNNKSDFAEFYWLSPKELLARLETGDTSKEDLPKLVKRFYRQG